MATSSPSIRKLMGVLTALAVMGLVVAFAGIQIARDMILTRIAVNSAEQWAQVLSFSVMDVDTQNGSVLMPGRTEERIDQAITDGLIIWYRVYKPDGEMAFSTNQTNLASLTQSELALLSQSQLVSRDNIEDQAGRHPPTTAEAFMPLMSGDDATGFVGVRVSRAEAGPLLDRILQTAFIGLCIVAVVLGTVSILILRRYLLKQDELERQLSRTTGDLLRSEAVAKVGHWSTLTSTSMIQWSPELYAICGRDAETFIPTNASVLSCIVPDERKRFQESMDRMFESGTDLELESSIQRPDGTVRHVFIKGGVEKDDEGNLVRIFGVTQDITDRKEADLALSGTEDMLDRAIEATDAAIWDWDIIEDSLYTTPRFAEILGQNPETWQPTMSLHNSLAHPDDIDRVRQAYQDHIEGLSVYDVEYRLQRANGKYIWIHSRGRAVRDGHGIATRMVGSVTDITDRKEEQDRRSQEELTLELAIQAADAGYFVRTWGEEAVYWSPRMNDILGITDPKFKPTLKSFTALVHPDDRDSLRTTISAYQESQEQLAEECRVKHADGRWIWVQLRAKIQRDDSGIPLRSVGFVIDVDERKKADLELERSKEKLELALEASQAGYFDHNLVEHSVEWSDRVYDILGFGRSFMPQENTFNALIHPDDLAVFEQGAETMRQGRRALDIEVRVKQGDGQFIWVQVRANQYRNTDGQIERTIGFLSDISDRKRIEKELEASKKLFEDVATAAGEYIWEFDRRGIFTFVSERVEAVLGIPAKDVIGRSPLDFMDAEQAPALRSSFLQIMVKREGFKGLQIPGLLPDGSVVWQQLSGTPIFDKSKKLTGYRGVAIDITAQKDAEAALMRSEEKFRDLIEGSIQGLLVHRKFKPLFVNDSYARILGFENADAMKHVSSLLEMLPQELRDNADVFWNRMISGDMDGEAIVGRVFDRHGNTVWTQAIGRRVIWDGEQAFQITVIDVTEQHRSQEALRESEERFRAVAENATDLITIRSPSGDLSYASPSAQLITGYTPDELINSPRGSMTYDEDADKLEQRREDRDTGKYIDSEPLLWRMRHKDGQIIWLETSSTSLPLAEGETQHRVLSMSRDVTDRVERERELEAARDRLTRQAEELSELAMRLEQERERAEEANVAKSQFLAKMSHELRTPMTGVLGMVDLLNQTDVDDSQHDMLNALHRSATALLELLNDILDVSKIEAGELEVERVDFSLSAVLQDVRELFAPVLSSKGLNLSIDVHSDVKDVLRGDPTRIRQVLLNLIGNANKFTESGGVTLNVRQQSEMADTIMLRVDVIDTGVGIAPEDQSRLFQAFVQAEAGTTRKYGGTGLGLAICRQLVEAMGGMIWVDSDIGKGSTFSFTIAVEAGSADNVEARVSSSHESQDQALRPLRVLVAEDNSTTQMLLRSMLERNGHTVETVDNGQKAVAAAQAAQFDIILMDMQMPVMDGPEAMTTIRNLDDDIASRPIIALTADAIREHRQGYIDAGANIVVTKPVNWPILFGEMARLTGQQEPAPGERIDLGAEMNMSSNRSERMSSDVDQYSNHILLDEVMLGALEEALDKDVLLPMVGTFKDNMDKYVVELGTLVQNEDLDQIKRTAHALKGLSAQFGASRVSAMAKDIEESITDVSKVKALMPLLGDSVEQTKVVLEEWL